MSNSSILAAGLILGFIVFITVRGELPSYLGVLGLGSKAVPSPTAGITTGPTLAQANGTVTSTTGITTGPTLAQANQSSQLLSQSTLSDLGV